MMKTILICIVIWVSVSACMPNQVETAPTDSEIVPTAVFETVVQPTIESTEISTNVPTEIPTEVVEDDIFYAWDFSLNTMMGETYTLSELRGKWVIVNFWATWCAPCREEIPVLNDLANQYPDDLVVLGINQRETADVIATFGFQVPMDFPVLVNPTDEILANYQVVNLPQTVIVAPNGELVWRQFGALDLDNFGGLLANFMTQ